MIFSSARTRAWVLCVSIGTLMLLAGCGASRPLSVPGLESSQVIKEYQTAYIAASRPPWSGSGIEVSREDIVVILASGKASTSARRSYNRNVPPERFLYGRVGQGEPFQMRVLPLVADVEEEGELRFTVRDWRNMSSINSSWYRDNTGGYTLHIFVVQRHRWSEFEEVLTAIAAANPGDEEAARQIRALLGPPADQVAGMDYGQLMEAWHGARTREGRERIIQAFGKRQEDWGLSFCFDDLVNGYFYNPWHWRKIVRDDLLLLADIYTVYPAGETKDLTGFLSLLEDSNPEVRQTVLEIMAAMKPREHTAAVYPLLFDEDYKMRIKALDTLIAIQNPEAANQISLLLIDPNKFVRRRAESALRALNVPPATINQWRAKDQQLNMDN